jgi:hypothetical protein
MTNNDRTLRASEVFIVSPFKYNGIPTVPPDYARAVPTEN